MHQAFKNPAILSLILANIVTIILAVTQGWSIYPVLWIYWGQSMIIGIVHAIRMRRVGDQSWVLFVFYYFAFHLAMLPFLTGNDPVNVKIGGSETPIFIEDVIGQPVTISQQDIYLIGLSVFVFLANHLYSLKYYGTRLKSEYIIARKNLAYPLLRILPIFFITGIVAVIGAGNILVFFLIGKTIVDVGMHSAEHKLGWI